MKKDLKLSLQASKFSLGDLEHPNKMPFTGLLTYFDIPSDKAVGGSGGKKVMIPSTFGIPSLASLMGMAVDFDPLMMDKHVTKNKIGVIDKAWAGDVLADGSVPVYVSGYVYAHDFPNEASDIKEFQSDLGFSYETIETPVVDGIYNNEPVLVVCGDVMFSGAAILLSKSAAYTRSSLAAQAEENEGLEVTELDFEQMLAKVIEGLEARYTLTAKAEEVEEVVEEVVEATEEVVEEVTEEVVEETEEEVVELQAEATEEVVEEVVETTVDFQAMATDLQASVDALTQELADLKAEAAEVAKNTHKGFAFPMTLAAKYNLESSADTYEARIASIDARTDLETSEAMALKFELRNQHLKAQK